MDIYEIINFKNYDIIGENNPYTTNNINLDEYVFLNKINMKNINISKDIDILKEMKNKKNLEEDIYIPIKSFINDIKRTFRNENSIWKQFVQDFPRSKVYINNNLIQDHIIFKDYLDYKFSKKYKNLILMLSTQAVLGLAFEAIFNNLPDNYHLSELDKKYSSKPFKIIINTNDEDINIETLKELKIFKLENSKVKNMYRVNVHLDLNIKKKDFVSINFLINKF